MLHGVVVVKAVSASVVMMAAVVVASVMMIGIVPVVGHRASTVTPSTMPKPTEIVGRMGGTRR